jgi:hypothetical protein
VIRRPFCLGRDRAGPGDWRHDRLFAYTALDRSLGQGGRANGTAQLEISGAEMRRPTPGVERTMTIILSAGLPRSGSTWLFNALRLLMVEDGKPFKSGWCDDLDLTSQEDLLVKVHGVRVDLAERASFIATCHRDLRDIAQSLLGMGWCKEENIVGLIGNIRRDHEYWSPISKVNFNYKDIISDPERCLIELSGAIQIKTDIRSTLKKIMDLAVPDTYDKEGTLLHPGHRQDGRPGRWREQLPEDLANQIEMENRDWLVRFGYLS